MLSAVFGKNGRSKAWKGGYKHPSKSCLFTKYGFLKSFLLSNMYFKQLGRLECLPPPSFLNKEGFEKNTMLGKTCTAQNKDT